MPDKKNEAINTHDGLQRFSTGINEKYDTPVFETLAITEDSHKDPRTGAAIPTRESIADAKRWVDENRL